jgi:hypothetical protein
MPEADNKSKEHNWSCQPPLGLATFTISRALRVLLLLLRYTGLSHEVPDHYYIITPWLHFLGT